MTDESRSSGGLTTGCVISSLRGREEEGEREEGTDADIHYSG
jgi:hypothetical protein